MALAQRYTEVLYSTPQLRTRGLSQTLLPFVEVLWRVEFAGGGGDGVGGVGGGLEESEVGMSAHQPLCPLKRKHAHGR